MTQQLNIAVIYSLPTTRSQKRRYVTTDEDTKISAEEIASALKDKGAQITLHPVSEESIADLGTLAADCIFNVIEWDGLDLPLTIRAVRILEERHIPITGSGSLAINEANNKALQKTAFQRLHLPTPRFQIFETGNEPVIPELPYPLILKPSLEHCSIGLDRNAIIRTPAELMGAVRKKLADFQQPIIADEFIEGREFQVTVSQIDGSAVVLPPAEIVFINHNQAEFLTYESRWDENHQDYQRSTVTLATLDPELHDRMTEICTRAFTSLGHRDYGRLDIRTRGTDVFILEANPNPGLGDDDDYGMTVSYKAVGQTFSDFVWQIVVSCLTRFGKPVP